MPAFSPLSTCLQLLVLLSPDIENDVHGYLFLRIYQSVTC